MNANKTKSLKSIAKLTAVAALVGVVSMPVAAKKYRDYRDQVNSTRDFAKVVDVAPIIETYQVNRPVEQCWDERVERPNYDRRGRHNRSSRNKSHSGEILGAIIGGAIGNKFGSGRGKKVATAAGAILGASVAKDVKRSNRNYYSDNGSRYNDYSRYDRGGNYQVSQRCEMVDNFVNEEQVVGYNVAYKYRGNVFHTQMDQRPGNKIKVLVTVNPV